MDVNNKIALHKVDVISLKNNILNIKIVFRDTRMGKIWINATIESCFTGEVFKVNYANLQPIHFIIHSDFPRISQPETFVIKT